MNNVFILMPTDYNPESGKYERRKVPAKMNWLPSLFIQGGENGVVFSLSGKQAPYKTAFVEVSDGQMFIRGEGETLYDAEVDAWEKWLVWCNKDIAEQLNNK